MATRFLLLAKANVEATYANSLIIAWLQTIRKRSPRQQIVVLLFSYPKYCLERYLKYSTLTNVDIKDYFSISCQTEEIDVLQEITFFASQHSDSVLVINCIDTLALQLGLANTLRFVEKLQQNHKSKIFIIHRRDFFTKIPKIETLSNTYVLLEKFTKTTTETEVHYKVSITHRKPGGTVVHSKELVCQNMENYNLTSEKLNDSLISNLEQNKMPKVKVQPQASFRIEMNEQEIKQRNSVPLPFVLSSSTDNKEFKIIYVPDDADDIDEEDPDDDLDI
ncbi:uncharacterized protein LOC131662990 isoform X2 [Phymastichus coffea]|uniref:uncharacterized protein LOC131662990 isoform X2 n=1 Tax=Phymastichus coffea TaxID=108790 RepID=UPI00273CF400|nr:uncharacterized protein LOC131662990 isoform X2 [Phymastichus coffea]